SDGHPHRRGRPRRWQLRGQRRQPGGTYFGRRPRRPDPAFGDDVGARRGWPAGRHAAASPWRTSPEGPPARASVPARRRRAANGLSADPFARRTTEQPAHPAHDFCRPGEGARRGRFAARPGSPPDPDRTGRHRQDAAQPRARRAARRSLSGRRLVRPARAHLGCVARAGDDRPGAGPAGSRRTSAGRSTRRSPRRPARPARPRQPRAAPYRGARHRPAANRRAAVDGPGDEPLRAPRLRRARVPVPPLGVPGPRDRPDAEGLARYESVALFVERAMAVRPSFRLTAEDAPAIAAICVRLDGLPLAIELAAARVKLLSPAAILARLENSLALLSGGAQDLPARQQTLRGAIGWSYDLLDEPDRMLFSGLSVFIGGAGLEAIEAVCGPAQARDVLDGVGSLVDKSLLRQGEGIAAEPRFTMLETIREYAAEQLAAAGREEAIRERHAAWFVGVAEQAGATLMSAAKRVALDRLELEHDNLRAALAWATTGRHVELALRLGTALWRFWQMRGH